MLSIDLVPGHRLPIDRRVARPLRAEPTQALVCSKNALHTISASYDLDHHTNEQSQNVCKRNHLLQFGVHTTHSPQGVDLLQFRVHLLQFGMSQRE